jgi:hypothetical protein
VDPRKIRFLPTILAGVSLHHLGLWGRASTEATYRKVQMHQLRKQPLIVRTMVGFVVIATLLCLLFGPTGILYALGLEVLYLLTIAFAAILDPDVY